MKKINWNKITEGVKKWRMGDYFRQLSIIILGIVVTFWGSDIIGNYTKQREVASVMQLVKPELIKNQKKLMNIKEKIAMECRICEMLTERNYQYEEIPTDTLMKYIASLNQINSFDYSENSMEVLKNSSLMQYISNKTFLLSLIQLYESMQSLQATVNFYVDKKSVFWTSLLEELTDEDCRILSGNNIHDYYRVILSFPRTKKYMRSVSGSVSSDTFDTLNREIEELIRTIEKKYE